MGYGLENGPSHFPYKMAVVNPSLKRGCYSFVGVWPCYFDTFVLSSLMQTFFGGQVKPRHLIKTYVCVCVCVCVKDTC